jgi:anti-sigma factor RsiW
MTDCSADRTALDAFADGSLSATEHAGVARHLAECPECRREVDQLRSLLVAARGLPRDIAPPPHLWAGIETRLGPMEKARPGRLPGRYRVLLAAAAAAILMVTGGALATWWQGRAQPAAFAAERARYEEATAQLATALASSPTGLSEPARLVLERNLRIIDDAIREAEAVLDTEPENSALAGMVLARYEQRLELLRRAVAAGRQES